MISEYKSVCVGFALEFLPTVFARLSYDETINDIATNSKDYKSNFKTLTKDI